MWLGPAAWVCRQGGGARLGHWHGFSPGITTPVLVHAWGFSTGGSGAVVTAAVTVIGIGFLSCLNLGKSWSTMPIALRVDRDRYVRDTFVDT